MVTKLKPQTEKSMLSRVGMPLFLLFWLCVIVLGAYELLHFNKHSRQIRGGGKIVGTMADTEAGSLGGEREAQLVEATKLYVKVHPDAPVAMAQGKQLAPASYLNDYLVQHHAKFRVREVQGMKTEMYDVW